MEYAWNKEKLKKLLAKDEKIICTKYSDEMKVEINSLKIALNMPGIEEVTAKESNVISVSAYLAACAIFKNKKVMPVSLYEKRLDEAEVVAQAKKRMSSKEKKYFNKLVKKGNFNISDFRPQALNLMYHNSALINIMNYNTLSDSRNIMHELAHAMYFNDLNYTEYINTSISCLRETLSILNEMIFIDRLDRYDDIVEQQTRFLNDYYKKYGSYIIYDEIKKKDAYSKSYALAVYLFMLYKNEKTRFDYEYNLFREELKSKTDDEIITMLNIGSLDMVDAGERYSKLYR